MGQISTHTLSLTIPIISVFPLLLCAGMYDLVLEDLEMFFDIVMDMCKKNKSIWIYYTKIRQYSEKIL